MCLNPWLVFLSVCLFQRLHSLVSGRQAETSRDVYQTEINALDGEASRTTRIPLVDAGVFVFNRANGRFLK